MSRTDVHRPYWVLLNDPYCRSWWTDDHDHSTGPCDLDIFLANRNLPWQRSKCHRQAWGGNAPHLCGCPLCTGKYFHKWSFRKERTGWRTQRQQLLKTSMSDIMEDWISPLVPARYEDAYYAVTSSGRIPDTANLELGKDS